MIRSYLVAVLFFMLPFVFSCSNEESTIDLVDILASETEVLEGNETNVITFSLTLEEPTDVLVSVTVSTEDFTAKAGDDYEAITDQVVSFTPGETSIDVPLTLYGDKTVETDEYIYINLSNPVNADLGTRQFRIKILDDENLVVIPPTGPSSPMSYDGMTLVWNDEFDGSSLDPSSWSFEQGTGANGWGNNELQYYTENNHFMLDGHFVIQARRENFGGRGYTSTRVITKDKREFQYGRIDIRAVTPKGQGLWPALWMLGADIDQVGWPRCGEIDIMELVGGNGRENTVHGTAHWQSDAGKADFGGSYSLAASTFDRAFHVFSIVWDENAITWYVDNIQYHTMSITASDMSEFHQPQFFIFNVAVGGNWPGNPTAATEFPQAMIVDYVRVFQKN